mmetsp:Transcript_24504/g.37260  ORF Transcript_24504/g.37260 Transcript_24504/m.37260 type:complete len:259 (+) Transcript_24504:127-903(+)
MSSADVEQPSFNPRSQFVKQDSMSMEYFIEARNLDKATAEMMRMYDKDGNGAFSNDEVVSIIVDLRKEQSDHGILTEQNKLYKLLLWGAVILCLLCLGGMIALSYGVAALTNIVEVNSDGSLVATGTDIVIATDSRAEIHLLPMGDNGLYCISWDETDLMHMEILNGREVVLDQTDLDGTEIITTLSAGSVTIDGQKTCFTNGIGETKCVAPNPLCDGREAGRTLSEDQRRSLGLPERRRRLDTTGGCYGCTTSISGN